nr:retrovirus-related Pol polyprotein from transposon TNT 1-94 [Tanacetum cinerariifolium]
LDLLGKFDGKADEGFLVGYSISSNAFRVFNSRTKIVQETLQNFFLENQPNVAGSGLTWMFDIDTLTQSMNYQPVVTGNQPNSSAGIQENLDAGKVVKEAESAQQYYTHYCIGPYSTNNTNSFNVVGPSDNGVSPNFEISGKYSFVDPSQYPGDPNMLALEGIVYLDDEEDVGAEADFSNLEITPQTRSMTRMVKEQGGLTQINDEDFHTSLKLMLFKTSRKYAKGLLLLVEDLRLLVQVKAVR